MWTKHSIYELTVLNKQLFTWQCNYMNTVYLENNLFFIEDYYFTSTQLGFFHTQAQACFPCITCSAANSFQLAALRMSNMEKKSLNLL